jgi:glycosyltransferase involved in cell wall biosynthesis
MTHRSIAFVTHWPPGVMGIGETCFALVSQLAQISHWRFSVYTNTPNPTQIPGVSVYTLPMDKRGVVDVAAAIVSLQSHDLVIQQMGNSSAHAFQWPLLEALPSVCHFHDLIYHRFWVWYYFRFLKKPHRYFRELFRFYPGLKRQFWWKGFSIWRRSSLNSYPLIEPHVEKSIGCIVHSEYSKGIIQRAFPNKPIYKMPLHKGNLVPANAYHPSEALHFGIFGSVLPNKRVDLIFQTFASLDREFPHWTITLVGPVAKNCLSLYKLARKLEIEKKVTFMGKVDKSVYLEQLNRIDCCISLRSPSSGESSGVVTECLILGVPVLVADLMWFSELPSFVDKIDPNDLSNGLLRAVRGYFQHPEILREKRAQSMSHASQHFSYLEWAKNYLAILEEFCLNSRDRASALKKRK